MADTLQVKCSAQGQMEVAAIKASPLSSGGVRGATGHSLSGTNILDWESLPSLFLQCGQWARISKDPGE